MNFLMLRGQIPQDRDPQEIVFDWLSDIDDMWTQLFYQMLNPKEEYDNYGELWYWGGDRTKKFAYNFTERWLSTFQKHIINFVPDVIFCRGGFPEYHAVLKRFPKAIKIYYGAGRRFLPQPGFYDYDIILQDSPEQVKICEAKFPKALTTLFIKPAADNIIYSIEAEKEYDVCFPANGAQAFKGHKFVYKTVPKGIKLLNLGNNPRGYKYPNNVTSYRVVRTEIAQHYAKCKMGIVAVNSEIDSCPRVIPEMLACGLPIVVLDGVRFWRDKYIESVASSRSQSSTGELVNKENFWNFVIFVLNNLNLYDPRRYYEQNLSLTVAAKFLRERINEIRI